MFITETLSEASRSAEHSPTVLLRGQLRLRLRFHVVPNTPGAVCLRGPRRTPRPVEPEQRHRGDYYCGASQEQRSVCTFNSPHSDASQVPTASVFVDGAAALNRVRWSHTGKEIATGDSEGQVQVFDVGEVGSSLRRFGYISTSRH